MWWRELSPCWLRCLSSALWLFRPHCIPFVQLLLLHTIHHRRVDPVHSSERVPYMNDAIGFSLTCFLSCSRRARHACQRVCTCRRPTLWRRRLSLSSNGQDREKRMRYYCIRRWWCHKTCTAEYIYWRMDGLFWHGRQVFYLSVRLLSRIFSATGLPTKY